MEFSFNFFFADLGFFNFLMKPRQKKTYSFGGKIDFQKQKFRPKTWNLK